MAVCLCEELCLSLERIYVVADFERDDFAVKRGPAGGPTEPGHSVLLDGVEWVDSIAEFDLGEGFYTLLRILGTMALVPTMLRSRGQGQAGMDHGCGERK